MKRCMVPVYILWNRGHRWDAFTLWLLMGWITIEAYCFQKRSWARVRREIEEGKK